ncbi:MAG: RDD family protein, partial [Planctomycetota bacterium]
MSYVGFWPRLAAVLIDAVVFLPLAAIPVMHASSSWTLTVMSVPAYYLVEGFYFIYLHGRWGQTIGKMCLRIRVV